MQVHYQIASHMHRKKETCLLSLWRWHHSSRAGPADDGRGLARGRAALGHASGANRPLGRNPPLHIGHRLTSLSHNSLSSMTESGEINIISLYSSLHGI